MLSAGIENLVQGASAMGDVRHLPQRGALQDIGNLAGGLQGPKAPAKAAPPRPELDAELDSELEAQFDSLLTGVRRGNDLRGPVAPIGKLPIAEAQITPEQPTEPAAGLAVVETAILRSPRLTLRDVSFQLITVMSDRARS